MNGSTETISYELSDLRHDNSKFADPLRLSLYAAAENVSQLMLAYGARTIDYLQIQEYDPEFEIVMVLVKPQTPEATEAAKLLSEEIMQAITYCTEVTFEGGELAVVIDIKLLQAESDKTRTGHFPKTSTF